MSTRIKFKEREETKGIALHFTKSDVSLKEYEKIMKRSGWFSVGYHYLIHLNGGIEEGIPSNQYADPSIAGYRDHVCVLIMGQMQGDMNNVQRQAVKFLASQLGLDIIYV